MINIKCSCGEIYHADERFIGQSIKCRHCNTVLLIESPEKISESFSNPKTNSNQKNVSFIKRFKTSNYFYDVIVVSVVGVLILVVLLINGSKTQLKPSTPTSSEPNTYIEPVKHDSKYKGNSLVNGSSPYNSCFGNGDFGGSATLTVKNGGSTDAIICLFNIGKDRTTRNVYIEKNTDHTINNISQGNYKIRVFYGNDWNPELANSCGTKGNFERDVNFSEFEDTQYFEDSDRGYTNASVTLYTVANGNAKTAGINKDIFFNK